jgi:hypothetical protein
MKNNSVNNNYEKFTYTSLDDIIVTKKNEILTDNQENKMTDLQQEFIWLAFAEKMKYPSIAKQLNVSKEELTEWTEKFASEWRVISEIKSLHTRKKISIDFKTFYDWYKSFEVDKKCFYCGITEAQIESLNNEQPLTKRSRGKKLELDRREPNASYDNINNLVYSCYWCNNAKSDTFTDKEFQEIGKVISSIWQKRLQK